MVSLSLFLRSVSIPCNKILTQIENSNLNIFVISKNCSSPIINVSCQRTLLSIFIELFHFFLLSLASMSSSVTRTTFIFTNITCIWSNFLLSWSNLQQVKQHWQFNLQKIWHLTQERTLIKFSSKLFTLKIGYYHQVLLFLFIISMINL